MTEVIVLDYEYVSNDDYIEECLNGYIGDFERDNPTMTLFDIKQMKVKSKDSKYDFEGTDAIRYILIFKHKKNE